MKAHCCILLLVSFGLAAQGLETIFSSAGYVEFQHPDPNEAINIILSASHGGNLKPQSFLDRPKGCEENNECIWRHDCGTTSNNCKPKIFRDSRTEEITREVANKLEVLTGKRPYVVINLLHRRKADMNREFNEATYNSTPAVNEYNAFHGFILDAIDNITANGTGRGILFDIHAVASHSMNWLELGYRISKSKLNSGTYTASDSSIYHLAVDFCGSNPNLTCFNELLYGNNSLGGLIQTLGIETVPSPQYNTPGDEGYFRGGYITLTYGALEQPYMDAIQVEIPKHLRLYNTYNETASKIGTAINQYFGLYY